ncbi:MAG: pyridoxamine 5'-phosphate oxidase family protein, partial [Promethearchaeota archaeon]
MSISISEKSLFTDYERIFLNRMRVARIATIDPEDNFPHLVPICYVLDNDLVYTSLSKNSKRLSNLNKTSEVSLLFDEYQEKNAVWLVLRGILLKAKVEILSYNEHSENFMRGWTKLIEKYP